MESKCSKDINLFSKLSFPAKPFILEIKSKSFNFHIVVVMYLRRLSACVVSFFLTVV